MTRLFLGFIIVSFPLFSVAQSVDEIITSGQVQRIESILSADDMMGRKAFTPSADKAAEFISSEFAKTGLDELKSKGSYLQTFSMFTPTNTVISATVNGRVFNSKNIIPLFTSTEISVNEKSGFKVSIIEKGQEIKKIIGQVIQSKENHLVFIDTSFSAYFNRLANLRQNMFKSSNAVIFILGNFANANFRIAIKQKLKEQKGANVVGIIPGKSKKEELVIFSGHYDHIGIGGNKIDTIYNGANDDASGITAVIEMAKYYKAVNNNERTLVFAAFTAEEIGGFGSQYFSKQLEPEKVTAMLNIEMIGTESKWGRNSAYITGFEKTDLGNILQKNLQQTGFKFYPDPYTTQDLFYRSDNATLARLGVPAHTISTSKMDNEPNYHQVTDEIGTLDIENMTEIIKSVVVSAKTLVDGSDTPMRVKANELTR